MSLFRFVDENLEDGEGIASESNLFETFLVSDLIVYRNSNMLYVVDYFMVFAAGQRR